MTELRKRKRLRFGRYDTRDAYLMLLPFLCLFGFFIVLPIITSLGLSLT